MKDFVSVNVSDAHFTLLVQPRFHRRKRDHVISSPQKCLPPCLRVFVSSLQTYISSLSMSRFKMGLKSSVICSLLCLGKTYLGIAMQSTARRHHPRRPSSLSPADALAVAEIASVLPAYATLRYFASL